MSGGLHEQTREHILRLSDEELAEYVATGTTLYEAEAVGFVCEEFQRRNIDPGRATLIQAEAAERARAKEDVVAEAAALPLTGDMKFMSFLGGFFITSVISLMLLLFGWHGFRLRGELLRASEMWRFVAYGVCTFLAISFALALSVAMYRR